MSPPERVAQAADSTAEMASSAASGVAASHSQDVESPTMAADSTAKMASSSSSGVVAKMAAPLVAKPMPVKAMPVVPPKAAHLPKAGGGGGGHGGGDGGGGGGGPIVPVMPPIPHNRMHRGLFPAEVRVIPAAGPRGLRHELTTADRASCLEVLGPNLGAVPVPFPKPAGVCRSGNEVEFGVLLGPPQTVLQGDAQFITAQASSMAVIGHQLTGHIMTSSVSTEIQRHPTRLGPNGPWVAEWEHQCRLD